MDIISEELLPLDEFWTFYEGNELHQSRTCSINVASSHLNQNSPLKPCQQRNQKSTRNPLQNNDYKPALKRNQKSTGSDSRHKIEQLREEASRLEDELTILLQQSDRTNSRRKLAQRRRLWRGIAERIANDCEPVRDENARLRKLVESHTRTTNKVRLFLQKKINSAVLSPKMTISTTRGLLEEVAEYLTPLEQYKLHQQIEECPTHLQELGLLQNDTNVYSVKVKPNGNSRSSFSIQKYFSKILPFEMEQFSAAKWESTVIPMLAITHGCFRGAAFSPTQCIGMFDTIIPMHSSNAKVRCCTTFLRANAGNKRYRCCKIDGQIQQISHSGRKGPLMRLQGKGWFGMRDLSTDGITNQIGPSEFACAKSKGLHAMQYVQVLETEMWTETNDCELDDVEKVAAALIESFRLSFAKMDQATENIVLDKLNARK
uniref:AlNc14C101G6049 protein n=1 Tax=Albugo laibachii Nc14 TaxID=890382 RepID=F0WHI6_9STRA|nr:AlNc14C101G6049 [Albugo laibachii Nc14]|eukprot:CCA20705.1 AlNc14C101G6049 [Albugo laibachii Nc14]